MMAKAKRIKTVEKLNLSEHTLDINLRKCSYDKFRFSDIEDYVRAVTGGREYEYQAIKHTMIYLWGGGYKNVAALAKENFAQKSIFGNGLAQKNSCWGIYPLPTVFRASSTWPPAPASRLSSSLLPTFRS
jgi:hypothetical protein